MTDLNFPPESCVDIRPAEKVSEVVVALSLQLPQLLMLECPRPDIQPGDSPVEGLGRTEPSPRLVLLLPDDEKSSLLNSPSLGETTPGVC